MKNFRLYKILGIFCLVCAILIVGIRGYMGVHFFASDKDFYPPAGQILKNDTQSFKFSIVADTGSQNKTLESILHDIVDSGSEFVLHLGDLVTYRTQEHMYWMTDELDDRLKGIPMYLIPGNHDVKKKRGEYSRANYRRVFGPTYYWFGYGNTLFIALDSVEAEISDTEWTFYETIMKKIRPLFKHVILYTHIPPINPPEMREHHLKQNAVEKMAAMIKKYPPSIIFAGHVHYYSKQNFMGIPLYTLPPSGQRASGPIRKFGYLDVTVDKKGIHVENHYVDDPRRSEFWDIFFINVFLGNNVRWIMAIFLTLGITFLVIAHILKKKIKI